MGVIKDYTTLKLEQSELKQRYAELTRQISARRQALKAYGQSRAKDPVCARLSLDAAEINARLAQIKLELSRMTPPPAPKPVQPEPPCARPAGQGSEINPHGMFQTVNSWERRLLGLMIAEIGDERYRELKKLAAYDAKWKTGSAPRYTTWVSEPPGDVMQEGDVEPEELPPRPEREAPAREERARETVTRDERKKDFDAFDRMMRGNYNRWF